MAPKIIRTKDASWTLGAAAACGVAATVLGFALSQRALDKLLHRQTDTTHGAQPDTEASDDGGAASEDASAGGASPGASGERPPLVAVRITRVDVQSCGDGDELDTPGERCNASPEVERILREALAELGDCPAALVAGQSPSQVLSMGLRVDFNRRIVVPVQGRASSVRDPLTFVACARQPGGMGPLDALFDLPHAKARYQYVVAMRFGPLGPDALAALDAGATSEPAAPTPTTAPARDAGPASAANTGTPAPTPAPLSRDAAAEDPTLSQPVTVFMGTPLPRTEPATVTWSRALIRAEPRSGVVITRIPLGTRVTIEARSGSWYRVRWASGMGWVFGDAIGRGAPDAGV